MSIKNSQNWKQKETDSLGAVNTNISCGQKESKEAAGLSNTTNKLDVIDIHDW